MKITKGTNVLTMYKNIFTPLLFLLVTWCILNVVHL